MVEALVISSLVVGFFLALLDYIPRKYKYIFQLSAKPWFRLIFSLIVSVLALFLIGLPVKELILVTLASSFLSNAIVIIFRRL